MKKNVIIFFTAIFVLITFWGIQSQGEVNTIINRNALNFVNLYLNGFQRYMFVVTFLVSIFIAIVNIPFWNSEIRVRIKNNTFNYIWRKYIIYIILLSLYILTVFSIVSAILRYENIFSIYNLQLFIRLVMFMLSIFVIYNIVYVNTGKVFLGIAICIVVNFCILIMSFAYQFVIYLSITDENLLFMLDIYTYIVNIIGMIYLYKMIDKKELIKQCIT